MSNQIDLHSNSLLEVKGLMSDAKQVRRERLSVRERERR